MMDNSTGGRFDSEGEPRVGPSKLVVVIDTDPGVRWSVAKGLERSGYEVVAVATVAEALGITRERPVAGIVMELLPEAGLTRDVLSMLVEAPGAPRVICVAVDSSPQLVIDCMRRGAADFLPKPFTLAEVRTALQRALEGAAEQAPMAHPRKSSPTDTESSALIGVSHATQELRAIIKQVARTDLNCLVRGESGTGKDLVAREIHRLSRRSDKPFVKVNCSALPEQLLESELFGYEKGAFTGAVTSKPGRFELAHRGVIFLDEIGDMHPALQAKLLQVIEHKEFTKLGGRRQIQVDVQIIAATNAELEHKMKEGSFRGDLYFRLNEVCIWVPPLAVRKEDVPLLVRHFVMKHSRFKADFVSEITAEDLGSLTQHGWPGNVRELESTIKRWLALGKSPLTEHRGEWSRGGPVLASVPAALHPEPLPLAGPAEPDRIRAALELYQWNRRKTAQALGMSYQTLRRRIEHYGLDTPR
jgi:DNA-binding NtrC family response regulator